MKNSTVISKISIGCKAIVVVLLLILIMQPQNLFSQPTEHPHYNPPTIVERNRVTFYKTTSRVDGKTLEIVAQDFNLNLDTLRKYNRHIGTGVIGSNVAIYYPKHLFDQVQGQHSSRQQNQIFSVVRENQRIPIVSNLENFQLQQGENFASTGEGGRLQKSNKKVTIRYQNRDIELNEWKFPAVFVLRTVDNKQVECSLYFHNDDNLMYDSDIGKYMGDYYISLNTNDNETNVLKDGGIRLLFTPANIFNNNELRIDTTNIFYKFSITDPRFSNPVFINIQSLPDRKSYNKEIIKEPVIRIETIPRSLEGYGIEKTNIRLSLRSYTGIDSVEVYVQTDKGTVTPENIFLTNNSSKTVTLRSAGRGTAEITATAHDIAGDSKVFIFNFPSMFLIFSLIGGFIGGLIKYLMNDKALNFPFTIILGVLVGFFVTGLWWGLGILAFNLPFDQGVLNEIMVLILAILGALYWEKIYSTLSKLMFSKKP